MFKSKDLSLFIFSFCMSIFVATTGFSNDNVIPYDGRIHLSYAHNEEFINFLKLNDGEHIQIKTSISADVSIWENSVVLEKCEEDNPGVIDQLYDTLILSNIDIPLPIKVDASRSIEEKRDVNCKNNYLRIVEESKTYTTTHGGTGVVQIPFEGIFLVKVSPKNEDAFHFTLTRRDH